MDKEEIIKKVEEKARFFEISKPKMIKVVQEEAKKLGINKKEAISTKAGEKFKKARDAEHENSWIGMQSSSPENVPFVNNMVIEEPEYGIFFTDEFGDQAFQRWSDIDKVGMEALVSYLIAASMGQSPENARFSMKLKNLIAEHPDQEKLKSKKVKLEAL
ncbi:hypothetical protein Tco_1000543 [Tanacetum coccineum]